MENSFASENCDRTVLLCGTGDEIHAIGQILRDRCIPSYRVSDMASAAERASAHARCVLIAERRFIVGVEASKSRRRLRAHLGLSLLAIGSEQSYSEAAELVRAGVAGFIQSSFGGELLERVFDCVQDGELWVTRKLLIAMLNQQPPAAASLLSRRELEVVKRMAAGCNNRQIAEDLYVTRDTVRWHLRSAYAKLGVHDRHSVSELLWSGLESSTRVLPKHRVHNESRHSNP